jgi:hypothetical protein
VGSGLLRRIGYAMVGETPIEGKRIIVMLFITFSDTRRIP